MQKGTKRADYVPIGPISRALKEWLKELDLAELGRGTTLRKDHRYFPPYEILIERIGLSEDSIRNYATGKRGYTSVTFDVADKILCATNRFNWWWDDPELSEVYEEAARGADKI